MLLDTPLCDFGARAPDFDLADFDGNRTGLQYRGRLDDARMQDPTGRVPQLVEAMQMVANTGAGPAEPIASMGCSIKWRG